MNKSPKMIFVNNDNLRLEVRRLWKRAFLEVMLIAFLMTTVPIMPSYALGTTLLVTPGHVEAIPGQVFTVNITVRNVSDLYSWQVALKYNATFINCTAAWVPDDNVFAGKTCILVSPALNQPTYEKGSAPPALDGYNSTFYGNSLFGDAVNVSEGMLCKLNFTVQTYGHTCLSIGTRQNPIQFASNSWDVWLSSLLNSNSDEMPFIEESGEVVSAAPTVLTITATDGGTTEPQPGKYTYDSGTKVQVNAISSNGYFFDHWVLDDSPASSSNPIDVLMTGDHNLTAVFSPIQFTGTIYIRADGKIDPPDVPISTSDNMTYTFSGTIAGSIIMVQKSHIVIDGNGYALQGSGRGEGFSLYNVDNVTIKNMNIRGFDRGVYLSSTRQSAVSENNITENNWLGIGLLSSFNNSISGNNIRSNECAIRFDSSSHNSVCKNNLKDNGWLDIYLDSSSDNSMFHNSFIGNANQVHTSGQANAWDNNLEGNYWSGYNGSDPTHDGIGDTPQTIDINNVDRYPLMGRSASFATPTGEYVNVISNSTIDDFQYFASNKTIKMCVSNTTTSQTHGFCRISIPHELMDVAKIQVEIDEGHANVLSPNYDVADNGTHRWIYFAYEHSIREVTIKSDTDAPAIYIKSPENRTYSASDLPLVFTVNETISWAGYSLNDQANVTVNGNSTLPSLADGTHHVVIYVNDTVGNMGVSNVVYFGVDTTPPIVMNVSQTPLENNVLTGSSVEIIAIVTDNLSGVKQVVLNYTNNNGTWIVVNMADLGDDTYHAVIQPFPLGTNITYAITAEDNANNTITTEQIGHKYQYQVVPELAYLTMVLLLAALTALAVLVRRTQKHPRNVSMGCRFRGMRQ